MIDWKVFILGGIIAMSTSLSASAQHKVTYTRIDSTSVPGMPEEYKDLRWYLFETDNFEILSIDLNHGIAIQKDVEALRLWTQRRWGFENTPYAKKCMVLCVPSQEIYRKWFRRDDIAPKVAKSKNKDGSDREVYGIWIVGEKGFLTNRLPEKIGRVNLLNHELALNVKFPEWLHIGMSVLNNDVNSLRTTIGSLDPNGSYLGKDVFDNSTLDKSGSQYRARAAALCLLLRKQQNPNVKFAAFLLFISKVNDPSQALAVYGWRDMAAFDLSYNNYVRNLSFDISKGRTPNMGLTWFPPKKTASDSK